MIVVRLEGKLRGHLCELVNFLLFIGIRIRIDRRHNTRNVELAIQWGRAVRSGEWLGSRADAAGAKASEKRCPRIGGGGGH